MHGAWCMEGTFAELQSRPPGNKVIVAGIAVRSSADLLVKGRIQVKQLRTSPVAVVRVLMLIARPGEHCSNPVTTKQMPRLDEPLSPVPAIGAQRADAANGRSTCVLFG